jgi:uncharacterized membrane protein
MMRGQGKLITGLVVGAGAMYLLDPERGARRRSLLRDQGIHLGHKVGDGIGVTARHTRNRALGVAAELRGRFRNEDPGDEVLHDRVRSAIGRIVSHPSAITVTAFDGRVTLTGHVLAEEVDSLARGVGKVRGVRELENELEIHRTSEGVPALLGSSRGESGPDLKRENWAPATRAAVGAVGGLVTYKGAHIDGVPGRFLTLLGLGLVLRAASNVPARKLVRLGQTGFTVEKTLLVKAPAEEVWAHWSDFENFPRFMAHLKEVRKLDEGHSHWVALGPAGTSMEWDAVVTDWVPQQFVGWTSVEGSPLETTGQVRLRPVSEGETQIDVQLSYRPPAGVAGDALASLFGVEPKAAMDEDLLRFKSLLEDRETSTPEGSVRLEELASGQKTAGRRGGSRKKS